MKKVYLPKDEEELFSVSKTKDGFMIPLAYFGYPNLHVQLFSRKLEEDLVLFNIHIKDESNNEMIVNKSIRFKPSQLESHINKKLDRLKKVSLKYFNKWSKIKRNSSDFRCLDCFREKIMPELPINKKNKAIEFYNELWDSKVDIKELNNFPLCNKHKHISLINLKDGNNYYRIDNFILTEKEINDYSNAVQEVFQEEFDKVSEFFDSVHHDFKLAKSQNL